MKFFENGRFPQFVENGRRPQFLVAKKIMQPETLKIETMVVAPLRVTLSILILVSYLQSTSFPAQKNHLQL